MIRTIPQWQRARWMRHHPGRIGLITLAALPLLYLVPLQRFGLVDEWAVGAWSIAFILPLPVTAVLMRDSASVSPAAVWLYQKGIRLQDVTVLRWLLDLSLVAALCVWAGVGILVGSAMYESVRFEWAAVAVLRGMLAALPAAALLFGVAAFGSRRGGDLLVLLAFVALLEPVLGMFLGDAARTALHASIMPMLEAAALAQPASAHAGAVLHGALHLTAWVSVWIAAGCWALRRWRPAVGARR